MVHRDVFISHASEDKEAVARPLAEYLTSQGLTVWLDEYELTIGDSLRRKIDEGLANSDFAVVILSHHFFAKEWPQKELDALVAREDGSEKVILPIWHELGAADVRRYSPLLADKMAGIWAKGPDVVGPEVENAVRRARVVRPGHSLAPSGELSMKVIPGSNKQKAASEEPDPGDADEPEPESQVDVPARSGIPKDRLPVALFEDQNDAPEAILEYVAAMAEIREPQLLNLHDDVQVDVVVLDHSMEPRLPASSEWLRGHGAVRSQAIVTDAISGQPHDEPEPQPPVLDPVDPDPDPNMMDTGPMVLEQVLEEKGDVQHKRVRYLRWIATPVWIVWIGFVVNSISGENSSLLVSGTRVETATFLAIALLVSALIGCLWALVHDNSWSRQATVLDAAREALGVSRDAVGVCLLLVMYIPFVYAILGLANWAASLVGWGIDGPTSRGRLGYGIALFGLVCAIGASAEFDRAKEPDGGGDKLERDGA